MAAYAAYGSSQAREYQIGATVASLRHSHSNCGLGCNCSSDLTPGLGAPNAMGWPKKKKGEDKGYGEDRELVKYGCSRVTWFCF